MSEKIDIHIDHYIAQEGGVGFYYSVMPSTELFGPFETAQLAAEGALAALQGAMDDIVMAALGIEKGE
jgi:hypothetical protein